MSESSRTLRNDLASEFLRELKNLASSRYADSSAAALALLRDAQRARVSDIRFEPRTSGMRLRFRIDGVLSDVAELPAEHARVVVNQFKAISDLDPVTRFTAKDTRATVELDDAALDIRLALAPSHHGKALVMRLLPRACCVGLRQLISATNEALSRLREGHLQGAAVLVPDGPQP